MFPRVRMFGSLFVLALAIRAIGYPRIFTNVGVQLPYAGDAYYHLRRIWFSVTRFPENLSFDRYASFPEGSEVVWPAAFDWTIAALIWPFVDPNDQAAVEAIAVWAPALLGAATTGLVALLSSRVYGHVAGWCAGLLYSVLPISLFFSRLGMIDHHVAVAMLTTIMLWLAYETFSVDDRAEGWAAAFSAPSTRWNAALGLSMTATLLVWPGALLHLVVLQAAFGLRWLLTTDRERARARAIAFSVGQAVVAIGIAPFTLGLVWREFGAWSPLVLSNFQPVYFASATAMICGVQSLHDRSSFGGTRGRRASSAIASALVGVVFLLAAIPSMRNALFFAGSWFGQGEELLGLINEMQPILTRAGHFDLHYPIKLFGAGFLVVPFVWCYLAWRAFAERSAPRGLILFWALAFLVLTLKQWRFGNTFAVVFAVMISAVLAEWLSRLRQRIALRPLRPAVEILLVVGLVAWTAVAIAQYHVPILRASLDALASEQRRNLGPLGPQRRIYDEAGRWLARHTAPTRGYLDPALQPEYAVLASWDSGHLLRYRSERPMVQDNFGPYAGRQSFASAWAYFASRDEEMAIEILDRLGVRYVIGGLTGAGSAHGLETDAMTFRLGLAFGSIMRLKDHGVVPGLSRHRLIFHAHTVPARKKRSGLSPRRPAKSLGVWEVVPGAQIEGHAEPGAEILLSLDLVTSSNAGHVYQRETVADDRGVYRFIVPYPTDVRFSPDVLAARAYQLRSLGAEGELNIREEDVLAGGVIRGPDLRMTAQPDDSKPRTSRSNSPIRMTRGLE